MSVETDPVPPAPEHTPPLREDNGTGNQGKYFNHAWTRWFVSLREKINVISESLVNLGDVSGTGIVVKNGDNWFARTLQAGFGIDITNPDGVAGDPVIIHEDTSSVANVSIDNTGGTVLQDVTFTFDTAGHVLTATFGSVNLDTRYLQDAPSNGSIYGRQNGAWVVVPGGGGTTVASVVAGAGIDIDNTDPANPIVSVETNLQAWNGLAISSKEDTITAGTTAQYWRGDKTWRDFATDARAAAIASAITDGDTTHAPSGDVVFEAIRFSGALVGLSGTQSITSGVNTTIPWGGETYDTDSYHNNAVNPSRLTVPASGYYIVSASVRYAPDPNGSRRAQLFKNGASFPGRTIDVQVPAVGQNSILNITSPAILCAAGDYFEVETVQDSGVSLNVAANDATWFAIRRIATD